MDFGAGKAGAFDLVCITDDQKGMGVDFHDNLIQGSHFAAGNDGHQDGLIGLQIAGRRSEKGAAAVKTGKNCLPDSFIMTADDVGARLMGADD